MVGPTGYLNYSDLGRCGRLGNALFEFAATCALADLLNLRPRFPEDWIHRPYFSVPDDFFGPPRVATEAWTLLTHIDERSRVYMQDYNIFKRLMPQIMKWLAPSELALSMINRCEEFHALPRPILSVHVRRGDNVPGQDPGVPDKENYFVLPTLDYYQRAIELLKPVTASIAVFSDDPEWCINNLEADYYHRGVPRPKEHESDFLSAPVEDHVDMQLMATCEKHVVTGSTFGIWGALLSGDKRAVRCSPVYGPKLSYINESLMFPDTWTRLEV